MKEFHLLLLAISVLNGTYLMLTLNRPDNKETFL